MTVEAEIKTRLSGFAGLSALISDRIYPVTLPQNVEMPAVSYRRVSAERVSAMGADTGLVRARFQFDCWSGEHENGDSGTFDEAKAVAKQVRLALQRWRNTSGTVVQDTFMIGDQDLHEHDTETYHAALDFEIFYEE